MKFLRGRLASGKALSGECGVIVYTSLANVMNRCTVLSTNNAILFLRVSALLKNEAMFVMNERRSAGN